MRTDTFVNTVLDLTREEYLVQREGADGRLCAIRPFVWTVDAVAEYSEAFFRYKVLSDDIPHTVEGFMTFALTPNALWFEVWDVEARANVGFVYVTDLLPSGIEKRFVSATFHAITWDAKAGRRIELAKDFIGYLFKAFRFHRLQAAIPLRFGGAIRIVKRLGFKDEGVMRSARRFNGEWYGVLLLSILEDEVQHG